MLEEMHGDTHSDEDEYSSEEDEENITNTVRRVLCLELLLFSSGRKVMARGNIWTICFLYPRF